MRNSIILLLLVVTTGCAHAPALQSLMVDEAKAAPPLNPLPCADLGVNRDCDVMKPVRPIRLQGKEFKIAGNKAGNIVLITHGDECDPTPSSCWTRVNNRNFGLMKSFLADKPVKILTVAGLSTREVIYAYRITFKGDAYSELLKLSLDPRPSIPTIKETDPPESPHASPSR